MELPVFIVACSKKLRNEVQKALVGDALTKYFEQDFVVYVVER